MSGELRAHTRGSERLTVSVDEHRPSVGPRSKAKQTLEVRDRLRPQRAKPFLAALAEESHARRCLEADILRPNAESFLNPGAGMVKKPEQHVIAKPLRTVTIGLVENQLDLVRLQVCRRAGRGSLPAGMQDGGTLFQGQGFSAGDIGEETTQRRKTASSIRMA